MTTSSKKIGTAIAGAVMALAPFSAVFAWSQPIIVRRPVARQPITQQQSVNQQSFQQIANNFQCNGGGNRSATVCGFSSTNVNTSVNTANLGNVANAFPRWW